MKLWTDGRTDDGRRTTEPSHPISSPGAFGSGELKTSKVNEKADTSDPKDVIFILTYGESKGFRLPKMKYPSEEQLRGTKGNDATVDQLSEAAIEVILESVNLPDIIEQDIQSEP